MDERLRQVIRRVELGDPEALLQLRAIYHRLGKIEELRELDGLQWFRFRDTHTFGITKTRWEHIWIEALDEDEAVELFKRYLGRDPYYWSCNDPQCCGTPDFEIEAYPSDVSTPSRTHPLGRIRGRGTLLIRYNQSPEDCGSHQDSRFVDDWPS